MFDIVEPFPLLSQTKARGWTAMVQKEGRLQAIICAQPVADGGCRRSAVAPLNHPDAPRAPVALVPRATLPVGS
jgi:hypothetical protein